MIYIQFDYNHCTKCYTIKFIHYISYKLITLPCIFVFLQCSCQVKVLFSLDGDKAGVYVCWWSNLVKSDKLRFIINRLQVKGDNDADDGG